MINSQNIQQRTIKKQVSYVGIGLHTGNRTKLTFKPAPPNSGIRFVRIDSDKQIEIPATIDNVIEVKRGTTIGKDNYEVHTVEHLMALCSGLGIDNLRIEIDSNELPASDGSCKILLETIKKAGICEQSVPRNYFKLRHTTMYSRPEDQVFLVIVPSEEFKITCVIQYNHPILSTQFLSLKINEENFIKEIAPARTFCFESEIESLKKQGLAKGGNLENAIVIGDDKIINPEKLRFPNEFVRHKILDLMGDLYLLGCPLLGHVIAIRCGHSANIELTKKLDKIRQDYLPIVSNTTEIPPVGKMLEQEEIKKIIPHRPPFLFIDRVMILEKDKKAIGYKDVSLDDYFFEGHFPQHPIMPGVIIIEAMAQTSCVLFLSRPEYRNKLAYFMSIEEVKFRKPVFPPAQLRLEVEVVRWRGRTGKVIGKAYCEKNLAAEVNFLFSLVDR